MKIFLTTTLVCFCLFFFNKKTMAETFYYVQNNTEMSFSVNSQQTGSHTMDSDEWWGMNNGTVEPWATNKNVLWSNRNVGIHNGEDFYLTATLTHGDISVDLQLRLNGDFVGSTMWHSIGGQDTNGNGFNQPWRTDNEYYTKDLVWGGRNITIKYAAYEAGTYNDVLFIIHDNTPYPPITTDAENPNIFNVLAYNIYMLSPPIAFTDQSTRAAVLPNYLHGFDALIISEAFDNSARAILQSGLSAEYPYFTEMVDESGSFEDGGVFIASRWPIAFSNDMVYDACDAEDCLAAKGAMYAKINKLGTPYHIFGTHTQAWNEATNVATRQAQFAELKTFMNAQNIPNDEAVIVGGDLNVDKILNNLNEYDDMFSILNASEPIYTGHPYTYHGDINYYGDDGYIEFLHYALAINAYRMPSEVTNNVQVMRAIDDSMWQIFDLSDHLAVHGRFVYETPAQKFHAKVLLEGAYDAATNSMQTTLNDASFLPTTSPYENHTASFADFNSFEIVDWLLVDAFDASQNVIETAVVLLLSDGSLMSVDGSAGASFSLLNENENYFFAIRHRNHLAIMSETLLPFNNDINMPYDFTKIENIKGNEQVVAVNATIYAMKAGDINHNETITIADFNELLIQQNQGGDYFSADINFDGMVDIADFNLYLSNASSVAVAALR